MLTFHDDFRSNGRGVLGALYPSLVPKSYNLKHLLSIKKSGGSLQTWGTIWKPGVSYKWECPWHPQCQSVPLDGSLSLRLDALMFETCCTSRSPFLFASPAMSPGFHEHS